MKVMLVGEVVEMNGQRMRYLGGGRFEPVQPEADLLKRYDTDAGEALHRPLGGQGAI